MVQFSSLYGERLSRELGNEDSTQRFTTARRKSAINEGLLEFADLTECYQSVWHTGPIPSTGSGNVACEFGEWSISTLITTSNFVRLAKAPVRFLYTDASGVETWLEGDDLPRRDITWLTRFWPGWNHSTVADGVAQLPQYYYLHQDAGHLILGFVPRPSTGSSASMSLEIPYVAVPDLLVNDTAEPFRTFTNSTQERTELRPYHQAFVHYAAAQLEKLRRDEAASERQLQKFLGYVARYLGQTRQKGGTIVTYVQNYFAVRGADRGTDPRR